MTAAELLRERARIDADSGLEQPAVEADALADLLDAIHSVDGAWSWSPDNWRRDIAEKAAALEAAILKGADRGE